MAMIPGSAIGAQSPNSAPLREHAGQRALAGLQATSSDVRLRAERGRAVPGFGSLLARFMDDAEVVGDGATGAASATGSSTNDTGGDAMQDAGEARAAAGRLKAGVAGLLSGASASVETRAHGSNANGRLAQAAAYPGNDNTVSGSPDFGLLLARARAPASDAGHGGTARPAGLMQPEATASEPGDPGTRRAAIRATAQALDDATATDQGSRRSASAAGRASGGTATDDPNSQSDNRTPAPTAGSGAAASDNAGAQKNSVASNAADSAAAAQAAAAALAQPVATDTDSTHVQRSLDALAPEFRTKLERVIERMKQEFGEDVHVVETWRSQPRQDALYAQGRTQPGQTVTWTKHSNHTAGLAANVVIEGGDDAQYARLAQLCAQEGLSTLGPSDPGHIELRGAAGDMQTIRQLAPDGALEGGRSAAPPVMSGDASAPAPVATVAATAQVARVASLLEAPAAVTAAARGALAAASGATVNTTAGAPQTTDTGSLTARNTRASQLAAALREQGTSSDGDGRSSADPLTAGLQGDDAARALWRAVAGSQPQQAAGAGAAQGVDIGARVARVLALQDAAQASPASGVTLHITGADGSDAARIRVGLRGTSVNAAIDVTDPTAAAQLATHTGELRQILERRGLDASVLIREAGEASPLVMPQAGRDASRNKGNGSNQNESAWARQGGAQQEHRNARRHGKENGK